MMVPSLDEGRPYNFAYRHRNEIPSWTATSASPPLKTMLWYLAVASVVVEFVVSANLLTDIGTSYVSEGGNLLEKVHPGSYLAILAGLCRLADRTDGARFTKLTDRRIRPLILFLGGIMFCCVYALSCTGPGGVIALVDTFLPAGMMALALGDLQLDRTRRLRTLIQVLLVMNAALALIEMVVQCHLVPVSLSGGDTAEEFRPTGLYDHPLTGAAATMMGLFMRPDASRTPVASFCFSGLMIAALLAFGERAPLVLGAAALVCCYAGALTSKLMRRTCRWRDTAPILAVSLVGLPAVSVAVAGGISSRLGAHFYWDTSAQVRMSEFAILSRLTWPEILFGCQRADLLAMVEPLRLTYSVGALENFWLVMFTTLGGLCFPIFVISLSGLLYWLWRRSECSGRMMIVTLITAASTSNSLGRKSTLLLTLVTCVIASAKRLRAAT